MDNSNKIQKYAILVSVRMLECICSMDIYNRKQVLGVLISSAMQVGVMALLTLYYGSNPTMESLKSSRILTWMYVAYLTYYGSTCFQRVSLLHDETNSTLSSTICLVLLAMTCLYCSKLGYTAMLRSSLAVVAFAMGSLVVLVYGVTSKMSLENLYQAQDSYNVLYYTLTDFSKSVDLIFWVLLMGNGSSKGEAYRYLGYKTLALVLISVIGISVLGGVSVIYEYPFLDFGAYSQPFGIQRADGLYTLVTTMLCVLNVSTAVILSRVLLNERVKSKRLEGVLILIMFVISYFMRGVDLNVLSATLVLVLSAVIPSLLNLTTQPQH